MKGVFERLNMSDEAIEFSYVDTSGRSSAKTLEGNNHDTVNKSSRDVRREQREVIYAQRYVKLLQNVTWLEIHAMIRRTIDQLSMDMLF